MWFGWGTSNCSTKKNEKIDRQPDVKTIYQMVIKSANSPTEFI